MAWTPLVKELCRMGNIVHPAHVSLANQLAYIPEDEQEETQLSFWMSNSKNGRLQSNLTYRTLSLLQKMWPVEKGSL